MINIDGTLQSCRVPSIFCTLKQKNGIKARDLLSNPIYCKADEISFDYFYQKNRNICSDEKDLMPFMGSWHII
jgi:hypothetical protein